jgi:hypothetical protein
MHCVGVGGRGKVKGRAITLKPGGGGLWGWGCYVVGVIPAQYQISRSPSEQIIQFPPADQR